MEGSGASGASGLDPDVEAGTVEHFHAALRAETGSLPEALPLARRGSSWATVRIFCSSTFLDHLEERRALERSVMPALEMWARERCVFVVLIDLVWGVLADTRPSDTVRTCFGELAECERANGAPYFLYLGALRYGWAPRAADLGLTLAASLGWVEGASITAMEVLRGGLRARRNPNALFCLRDEAFVRGVPEASRQPAFQEKDADADLKQRLLLEAIESHASPEQILRHSPVYGDPASWDAFGEQVTEALKRLIGAQYPPVEALLPGSLAGMRRQHNLVAATLADSAVLRATLLASLREAATCGRHQVLVVAAPSGRGKSSALAQLARTLRLEGAHVISHFVSKASSDLSALARRIAGELQLAYGDSVDEQKLPTDALEACALARATLLRRGADEGAAVSPLAKGAIFVIVDAVNELRGDVERKLDWLPDAAELAAGMRVVVIVSCTLGDELAVLSERLALSPPAGSVATAAAAAAGGVPAGAALMMDVEVLNEEDRRAVCAALLARYGKRFDADQMLAFISHPGAGSPLWQCMALARLRQRARFETVSALICELPPVLEELIQSVLEDAEALVGREAIQGLLLGCSLSRHGLHEHEASQVLPLLIRAASGDAVVPAAAAGRGGAGAVAPSAAESGAKSGAPSSLEWANLRAALDPFLLHAPAGAPVIIVPSHGVVRAAILHRYSGGDAEAIVLRALASFFDSGHSSVTPARRAAEACWAHEALHDSAALARTLCSPEVLNHFWFGDGDAGRWELSLLWGVVGKLDRAARGADASEDEDNNDVAVAELAQLGARLAEQVAPASATVAADAGSGGIPSGALPGLNVQVFALVRATSELLQMLRRSGDAVPFLRDVEARLLALAERGGGVIARVALAWTRLALGLGVRTCGDHLAATLAFESAVEGFERAGLANNRMIVIALVELGRTFQDLYDETEDSAVLERAVTALERARAVLAGLQSSPAEGGASSRALGSSDEEGLLSLLLDSSPSHASGLGALQDEADVLNALANVRFSLKDYDAALHLYRQAYALLQRALGDWHPHTMRRGLWGVAIVQKAQGALAASVESHRRMLTVFTRAKGARHPDVGDMHYNLGQVFEDMGDFSAAAANLRAALAIYAHVLGPRHKDVAWTTHDLGGVLEKGGDLAGAAEAFATAASIRAEKLGEDEARTRSSRAALARVNAALLEAQPAVGLRT